MIAVADKEVTHVLIKDWWYTVHSDFEVRHSPTGVVEYSFRYYPKNAVFSADPLIMHVSEDQIDGFKYDGKTTW